MSVYHPNMLKSIVLATLHRAGHIVVPVDRKSRVVRQGNGKTSIREVKSFGALHTEACVDDLFTGPFDKAVETARSFGPVHYGDKTRIRLYHAAMYASIAVNRPGDFLFAGVAHAIAPHCIAAYLGDRLGEKKFVFVDPYDAANPDGKLREKYTTDGEGVAASFNGKPHVDLIKDYAPDAIPAGRYCFAMLNTGSAQAHIAAIPRVFKCLPGGGIMLICSYTEAYRDVFSSLDASAINLLDKTCVIVKH